MYKDGIAAPKVDVESGKEGIAAPKLDDAAYKDGIAAPKLDTAAGKDGIAAPKVGLSKNILRMCSEIVRLFLSKSLHICAWVSRTVSFSIRFSMVELISF